MIGALAIECKKGVIKFLMSLSGTYVLIYINFALIILLDLFYFYLLSFFEFLFFLIFNF